MGQELRPFASETNQVVAVGAIAVEEHHELPCSAAGSRGQSRSIEGECHSASAYSGFVGRVGVELAVILNADLVQEIELRLEVVDVALFVGQQLLEQIHAYIVFFFAAGGTRLHVQRTG